MRLNAAFIADVNTVLLKHVRVARRVIRVYVRVILGVIHVNTNEIPGGT